jgi:hypothetical protein
LLTRQESRAPDGCYGGAMAKRDEVALSPLVASADALDAEVRRFEELTASVQKAPLDSHKSIDRAADLMEEIAECQTRIAGHVDGLLKAITAAHGRQQIAAEVIMSRADAIRARRAVLVALVERFAALGQQTQSVNELLQQGVAEGTAAGVIPSEKAIERLGETAEAAAILSDDAEKEGFRDVANQADTLKQQLLSAKNKLTLLTKKLS